MKLSKKILAAALAALMAISMMPTFALTASATAMTVTDASPVKYGLVRTGNSSRGSGDNGCITNDGGDDNMSAILWEFNLSAIHEGYEVTSATLSENIWSISNKNIPNQYLDFWYCNPADMSNYSNYLNNGNYRDSSLGYGTNGPSTYKAAFGITESTPLYSSQHVYNSDEVTLSFSNQALIDALNKAAEENWGAIVFVAMYNEPAATTWSDIWAGLPKLSFATTAKPSESYAKEKMASYDGSNLVSTSSGIQFSSGGDAYKTNVLYTVNGNYDSNYFEAVVNGDNKFGFNVYPASSRAVYLYDSDDAVIGYPLIAKAQDVRAGITTDLRWAIDYLAIDGTNDWKLTQDWIVTSSDRTWDDILSSKSDQAYGVYKVNYDPELTSNYNSEDIGLSSGPKWSGHYSTDDYITYRNVAYLKNSSISFGNNYYYTVSTLPLFKARVDAGASWWGNQKAWNNLENWFGISINGNTSIDLRVLNIKPLKDIVSSADFKSNFNTIKANESLYTAESLANYYDIIARIIRFNVNYLDVSNDAALASSAAEIKSLVDDYNLYKTPAKKIFKATFKNAAGSTVNERNITAGDALGALPANTAIASTDTKHHNAYSWSGITADTVIEADSVFTEATTLVDCSFADVHTDATDAKNGFTTYTCDCGNSYVEYDALSFTAYEDALEAYNETINGADYANYTAESRTAYEKAVADARLTAAQIADETLAPKKIADATEAIIAANELLKIPEAENTYNLTLDDSIEVNFNIDTEFYGAQDGTIEVEYVKTTDENGNITVGKDTVEYPAATEGKTPLTLDVAPAQIAEPYVITVKDSQGGEIETITTSIADYCAAIIGGEFDAKEKEVARGLLDYGASAEVYFNYREKTTPGYSVDHSDDYDTYKAGFDAEDFKEKAKCSQVAGVDASGKSVYVTGVSYLALLDPEFRFYVNQTNEVWAAMTEVSIDDPELTAEMVKTANGNCVRVTGLKASDFAKTFTITIGTYELTYNGYAYLYTILRDGGTNDDDLRELATGAYRYAAACEAKFAV